MNNRLDINKLVAEVIITITHHDENVGLHNGQFVQVRDNLLW